MPPRGAARGGSAAPSPLIAPPPPPGGLVLPSWALAAGAGLPVRYAAICVFLPGRMRRPSARLFSHASSPPHSDPATYLSQYAPSSDLLILQDGREAGRRVPLFGAAHVRGGSGSGASTSMAAATPTPSVQAGVASDVVCFAGGPVWALDWCPQIVREGDRVSRFLAVSWMETRKRGRGLGKRPLPYTPLSTSPPPTPPAWTHAFSPSSSPPTRSTDTGTRWAPPFLAPPWSKCGAYP